ncbi:MAG TPA: cellulase family glycosylhydrolase [bacterium]|nr:cellulase family glycosylhydrolase [bacterium]
MNIILRKSLVAVILALLLGGCRFSGDDEARRAAATPAPFHTDGRWIKDDQGRVVILRGINVGGGVKWDPWQYWYGEREWDLLMDWGMNVVRMLIIWEPIEPEPGQYTDWLFESGTDQLVAWSEERGINVILDMHQDVYGPAVSGDGAAPWATRTDIPFKHQEPWGINYLARAVNESYDDLWTDPALQNHFIGAWLMAVQRYRYREIIIGYDLFNEPWPGTSAPWEFSRNRLGKFQDRVAQAIRALDANRIIFYEPLTFTAAGMPANLPPPAVKGAGYAPHFYDPTLGFVHDQPYDLDPSRMNKVMDRYEKEARWMGNIPWLMGEFGVTNIAPNWQVYLQDFYNALDAHMASGTIWEYGKGSMGPLNPDGSEKTEFVNEIVRTYPQRIAGEPVSFGFDPATRVFTLTYNIVEGVTGPTEIFIPEARHYPAGFRIVSADKNMKTEWDGRILKVWPDPDLTTFTIIIAPNS